jgi:signal transduction histidine kinase
LVILHKEKHDIIKEIYDLINLQLESKIKEKINIQINFINKSLGERTLVYVDRLRLNQILHNLLDNAIKLSKQDGSIDIVERKVSVTLPPENKEDHRQVWIEQEGKLDILMRVTKSV